MPKSSELLELLLTNRGIKPADFERFLKPDYEGHSYDPFFNERYGESLCADFRSYRS